MWYIVAESYDPRARIHRDQFKIDAKETWVDEQSIMFQGYGTRSTIGRELLRLRAEHPGVRFRAFWCPDWIIDRLMNLGAVAIRASEAIHRHFENKE